MLNFAEFQEYAKNHVKEYMPESFGNAVVSINTVNKNNGLQLHGIVVRPENSSIAPTIYLDGYFKKYEAGSNLDELMSDIADVAVTHAKAPGYSENIAEQFKNFDYVKDKVIMAAVNVEKNEEMLMDTPHTMVEDLALIYKVALGSDADGMATITIKDDHLAYWGVTTEELHSLAMENSNRIVPATLRSMNDIMMGMMGEDMPEEVVAAIMADMPAENQMYVISNANNVNGAAAMFYSNELEKLADKIGTDLYILPSSVHECIAVSTEMGSPEMLAEMVQEVNGTQVSIEEQLSDHVYLYDAKAKSITLADTSVEELGITSPTAAMDLNASSRSTKH